MTIVWIIDAAAIIFFIVIPLCGWIWEKFIKPSRTREGRIERDRRRYKRGIRAIRCSDRRAKREIRRQGKKTTDDVLDEAAHTLAVHQELLREMYGNDAPSASKIIRRTYKTNQRRHSDC